MIIGFGDAKTGSEDIAAALSHALAERGMSQRELAWKAGLTPSTVSRVLSGRRGGSADTLTRMMRALGLELTAVEERDNGRLP